MMYRFRGPSRVDSKASHRPSGLKQLRSSSDGCAVSRAAVPPAAGTDQRSPAYAKTIAAPSGDTVGYCGKATGCVSSATRAATGTPPPPPVAASGAAEPA